MAPNKASYALLLALCWLRFVATRDSLCDQESSPPTGKCCPREYVPYCCPGIPVCSDGGNDTSSVINRVVLVPGCSTPWNLTACNAGFYSQDGNITLPCPSGFFCEENELCLKPCPEGSYCIQTFLANCSGSQDCCQPLSYDIVIDGVTSQIMCAGSSYPVPCSAGFYCPTTTTIEKCPSGHFCRGGSKKAVMCPVLSWCGEGETSANTLLSGIIINACVLFLFIVMVLFFKNRQFIKFHVNLFKKRVTGTRRPSQRYNLSNGIRLAIKRLTDFDKGDANTEFEPNKTTYNISFENLSLKLNSNGKVILQGVTGKVNGGEVTAVLGPSGSGKTTFLNVLCGKAFYGERGGTVRINDKDCDFQDYKQILGFVPQDDIMHRSLTVGEVLYYNALLRLPPQADPKYRVKMVKKVLNLLGIRHVANSQIGDEELRGISGGQRRRVNIGMELVADPAILFLDEPTTGLDSSSSLAVVKALNTLASKGNRTVMCVVHQPRYEILKMFDKLLLLGRGGRTVYSGTVDGAQEYFTSIGFALPPYMNPADYYLDVITGNRDSGNNLNVDLFNEWRRSQDELLDVEGANQSSHSLQTIERNGIHSDDLPAVCRNVHYTGPSCFIQFWIFLKRELVLQFYMAKTLLLDQILVLLGGAVVGLLFREVELTSVGESNIFGNIAVGLVGVVAALRCFGQHRVVFWRESARGVNRFSYFMAMNVAYIPIIVISPAIYLSILYNLVAYLAPFSHHYLVYVCAWFYLSGVGYILSLIMIPRNSQMAAIILVVLMAAMSGATTSLCELDDTYVGPVFYNLSFSRWVAEAVFEIEANERAEVMSDIIKLFTTVNHYDLNSYNTAIAALISMGFGFRVIAFLLLIFTKRGQQK